MSNRYAAFEDDLRSLLNQHSMENGSDTPDFILARHLVVCLKAFDAGVNERRGWYAPPDSGGTDG